jgi:integrase
MPLRLVRFPKRSPHWYIRGSVRGQNVFETTGTDDAKAADAIRIKREAALLDRSVFGVGASRTFAEAAVSYLEGGGEARFLGALNPTTGKWSLLIGELGDMPLGAIGQETADDAARNLYPRAGNATRKRQAYIPLCAVLNHAANRKWCAVPAIEHPSVKIPETKWSSPERLAKLLPHCAPKLRRFIMVSAYTGARLSEVLRLDWDRDVSLSERVIMYRRPKNKKLRVVRIADPLLIELATVPESDRHGLMFDWADKRCVYVPLQNACKRAGVDYLPPHQQGRHTFGSWLRIYAKRDLRGIMEDGGWDSVQSVIRYLHVSPGESADAVDQLPSVHSPCTEQVASAKMVKQKRKIV